jgi:PAS domain S-box-containing protein
MKNKKPDYEELERKVFELERQAKTFKLILDHSPDCCGFRDEKGKIVYLNPAFEKFTGYKTKEFINGELSEEQLVHPDDLKIMHSVKSDDLNKLTFHDIELRLIKKDKNVIHACISRQAVYDEENRFIGICQNFRDITKRKIEERKLQNEHQLLTTLSQIAPVGIFRTDPNGDFIYTNEFFQELSGINASEAVGNGWFSTIYPEDRDIVIKEWYQTVKRKTTF